MPQKRARPLYLAKLLQERTDEDHPLTVPEMLDCLARQGIPAERKAIYEDLELLRTVGMDIVHTKTKTHNYNLGQRTFQLAEVKLLIDVVQASPFLTARKSMELIRKLESLTSVHQAAGLSRQVYVLNRLKTPNEQLYYLIDAVDRAIQAGRVIRFRYFDWTVQGRRIYRHNGAWYEESPVALCVDRNYYLITYRPGQDKYIHFRVDRMDSLEVTEKPRAPLPPGFDLASYVRSIFDMHSGSSRRVTLELDGKLLNVARDRFGDRAHYRAGENGAVIVSAQVDVSPTFLGWVLTFGKDAKILEPPEAREALRDLAREALGRYEEG